MTQVKAMKTVRSRQNLEVQILKVEPYGYFDGQAERYKREKGVKDDVKTFALSSCKGEAITDWVGPCVEQFESGTEED